MNNYFAKDDPIWVNDHYVEDWEVQHIESLPPELHDILVAETGAGNRVSSASNGYPVKASNVWFSKPKQVVTPNNVEGLRFSRSETPHDRYECIEHVKLKKALLFPLK